MMDWLSGSCYVFQPQRARRALRISGSTMDFAQKPAGMLSDLGQASR